MPKTDKGAEAYLKLLFWNAVVGADSGPGPDIYDNFAAGSAIVKSTTAGHLVASLHTAVPTGSSQASNEFAYTGYSRISIPRAAANWTYSTPADGGGQMANAGTALSYGKMTGGTGGVARFWGLGTDTGTGAGNLLYYGPLALTTARPFTTIDTASGSDIVCPGHGYSNGDQVCFLDVPGAALPSGGGFAENTYFYVISSATNTFQIEATLGGGAITVTGVGAGYVAKVLEKTIALNDEPKIDTGAMIIIER